MTAESGLKYDPSFPRCLKCVYNISIKFNINTNFLLDDMTVYNQSMIMGGNTLDKRHADFNDELGYIAPPNRKLPPVPGSNYNTCDRIKRGINYFL